jgi:hypothetical protein
MTTLDVAAPADAGVHTARMLLIATLIAMMVSTSLTVGLELAVYAVFLWFPALRARLWTVIRQPAAIALLIFLGIVLIGALHGPAPWADRLGAVAGWRKAFLFFLAAAAFDDVPSKRRLAGVFFAACLVAVTLSFVTHVWQLDIYKTIGHGIIIINYGTQSIVFAIAASIAAIALIDRTQFAGDPLLKYWLVALVAIVLFIVDIAFVLRGRSGYLALVVMAGTLAVMLGGQSARMKATSAVCVLAAVVAVLAASERVRGRIAQAIDEMENVERSPELTSAGIRVVMWQNTMRMIGDHPVLGVGTGSFHHAYQPYIAGGAGWQASEATDPHNQYMKIWAEQGSIGLLALLVFVATALATRGPMPYRAVGVGLLLAICASSFFNSHFSTFTEGRLVYFWLGAMLASGGGALPLRNSGVETI